MRTDLQGQEPGQQFRRRVHLVVEAEVQVGEFVLDEPVVERVAEVQIRCLGWGFGPDGQPGGEGTHGDRERPQYVGDLSGARVGAQD
ncbi:hypothetical protein [Streptomyces albospinus]|uniref:hypothetical protein n=1 Tax=Streptomyces albospinus TaxID=285515 RepID=UPI0016705C4D|nr:hypothetical protein [Streptomyces albospinus]